MTVSHKRVERYKQLPRWKQRWIYYLYELKSTVKQCKAASDKPFSGEPLLLHINNSYHKMLNEVKQPPLEFTQHLETCHALQLLITCILQHHDKFDEFDSLDHSHLDHIIEEIRPIYQELTTVLLQQPQ